MLKNDKKHSFEAVCGLGRLLEFRTGMSVIIAVEVCDRFYSSRDTRVCFYSSRDTQAGVLGFEINVNNQYSNIKIP